MSEIQWTSAEREAVREAAWRFPSDGTPEVRRDAILAALAPFVAERERQAAARALREAADHATEIPSGYASKTIRSIKGIQNWLRARADRIEREGQL